jgi:hypothetical protein
MSPQQMIDLAYVIFAKQPILQQDLRLWNRKPAADRTWANMMTHLCEAQADLSSLPSAGDIYHQQPPHQANIASMAELVAQRLLNDQNILQNALQNHPASETPPPAPTYTLSDVTNSLQHQKTDLQTRESSMMTQMQQMMIIMMQNNGNNNNNNKEQPHQQQQQS